VVAGRRGAIHGAQRHRHGLIGFNRDLGLALAFLATPAGVAAGLLLLDMPFLLPRDYLGPLRLPVDVR
jgi:hypothetical protein